MGEKTDENTAALEDKNIARSMAALHDLRASSDLVRAMVAQRRGRIRAVQDHLDDPFETQMLTLLGRIDRDVHVFFGQPEPVYSQPESDLGSPQQGMGSTNDGKHSTGSTGGGAGSGKHGQPGITVYDCPHCGKKVRVSAVP